ncbi:UDP-glucosyltransferase A1 [Podospora australis]|uniref:UDP-glucosyltransferase A1 n=1 Tax=Podospora australis TaxID=1536484 RepID=A0AAN7AHG5_9PEZI|nr:UDP-glucosyltransferase A1 [Podospora australis]
MATRNNPPLVLMCSTPVSGHIIPMLAIAKQLVVQGYTTCFVSSSAYRQQIEKTGALFVPVQGYGDFYDLRARDLDPQWPTPLISLEGPAHFCHDLVHIFCKSLPSQHHALQVALRMLTEKDPDRPVILMTESLNFGALPLMLGASGNIRPQGFIAVGLNPVMLSSADHPPFGPGSPPDSSPEGRERNKRENQKQKQTFALAQQAFCQALESVGAKAPETFLLDALYTLPDRFVQMCTPRVEYLRSDAPQTLRFAGGYPRVPPREDHWQPPTWWNEVTTDNGTKKTIFVCQGTVATDLNQLAIPTMSAFAERSDVTVVLAIGRKGARLSAGTLIPTNARVVDYIPYDQLLPHCDVFVTTGGYGAFQRALYHGCPLVIAGTTEEKPETAARAEWAGVAVNLRTSNPSIGQLREAVDRVLSNQEYKAAASKIQAEIAGCDPVRVITETIEELAGQNGRGI